MGFSSSEEKAESRNGVKAVKDWLYDYRDSEKEIDAQIERLERLEAKMYSVGSPEFSDMPKAPGVSGDKIASMVAKKEELENEIKDAMRSRDNVRHEIEKTIKQLKHADERAVIRMRYIDSEKWTSVTEMLFGRNDDFYDKESSYLRRVTKLHGQALVHMAKIMDDVK